MRYNFLRHGAYVLLILKYVSFNLIANRPTHFSQSFTSEA